ncbi:MAG: ABC-2 transporter permease [Clostridia bacterium]|nr:ABC-2 transporter permease [Clostridia bacterium]
MKALLNKEFKLCLHPAVFIYLALILMLLIPNYPYLVSCFFVCNAIFFCFQQARENGDAMYTAMLPVSKAQAVRARVLFVVIIQAIDLLLVAGMCAFAIVSMPEHNAGGTDHGLSLLAFALVLFAIFNIIYLPSFYKTGYKAGTAFLKSAIGVWLWLVLCEGMMIASNAVMESGVDIALFRFIHENIDCMPKTAEAWTAQGILFGAGILIYVVCTLLATKISVKRYEKVSVA